jgi:hypothetical protein
MSASAGKLTVTDASGSAITSLAITGTANVTLTASGDVLDAGVNWTVTCQGNPLTGSQTGGACGTLSPAHTTSGSAAVFTAPSLVPAGNTVTITGTLAGNSSQSKSVTLTIVSKAIAVAIENSSISLATGGTTTLKATTTYDTASTGVSWKATCGSSDCGSFGTSTTSYVNATTNESVVTYTAPATAPSGGTVTLTATSVTDTTKSASKSATITTPVSASGISVSVSPATFYVKTGTTTSVTATVANDSNNAGVTWSVSCASTLCGIITPSTKSGVAATYIAPATVPSGAVAITATSVTDTTKTAQSTATVISSTPISVTFSSAPGSSMHAGAQATLAATVANDTSNAGVDWTVSCGSAGNCGSFSPAHTASGGSTVYTAPATVPANSAVTITAASSSSKPANSATATVTILTALPVTITQEPPTTMAATAQATVSATVSNDSTSSGVYWTLTCGSTTDGACGAITPYHTASGGAATYTAPPVTATGTSVTITATSVADSTESATSNTIAIVPATALSANFLPAAPAKIQAGTAVNLNAYAANDSTQGGVDWQVCASGCGFFTTKPAKAAVQTSSTYVPAQPAVTATSVSGWPNGTPLPYTAPTEIPTSGNVQILISAHANSSATNSALLTIAADGTGPELHGKVMAGSEPVAGASVSLYAAGTRGYALQATQLYAPGTDASVQTDSSGVFTIPAGYVCPSSTSQVYLVATGGTSGSNTSANPQLAMMTALGNCGALSSTSVVINEVTTAASVGALAQFASNDSLTGKSSYLYLGTSSGNAAGLANAFAAVNNLVDITTGQARFWVPSGNAAVPYIKINTLADILNACTSTTGGVEGDGSACGTLLTGTDPLYQQPAYNSTAPTDTLQAAFNIAQHPGSAGYNFDYLIAVSGGSLASPFQPFLSSKPNDWTMQLHYTSGGGITSSSAANYFAVDASGNLWITDSSAGTVAEWTNTGAAASPSSPFSAGGAPIAVDASGNAWISDDTQLRELDSTGDVVEGSPYLGVSGGGKDMAFDASGYLWITGASGIAKFDSVGTEVSTQKGYTLDSVTSYGGVVVDGSNNVRVAAELSSGSWEIADILESSGASKYLLNVGSTYTPYQMAMDGSGSLWYPGTRNLCKLPKYAGISLEYSWTCYVAQLGGTDGIRSLYNARGIAIDGAGKVWFANAGGSYYGGSVTPNLTGTASSASSTYYTYFNSSPLSAGPVRVAVDNSGNVWVLLADNTMEEFVGIASPAVTPLATAVKKNKIGAEP